MNPQQPNGAFPPPPPGNPYEFITAGPPKPARQPSSFQKMGNSNPMAMKLVLIIGGSIALIIAVTVLVNVLFGDKTNYKPIIGLTQTQQELARVTQQGEPNIADQAVAGAAINTRLTIQTQQRILLNYLTGQKQKLNKKDLELKKDTTTDKQLAQAKATSTLDLIFTQVMRQQLTDYADELNSAYKHAPGNEARKLIKADYEQTKMLLDQWPQE